MRSMMACLALMALTCAAHAYESPVAAVGEVRQQSVAVRKLSPTRQLRRIHLSLLGREPTIEAYQAMLAAPDQASRQALLQRAIEDALASPAFHEQMVAFGHDYLRVGTFDFTTDTGWTAGQAIGLDRCDAGTAHAGKLALSTELRTLCASTTAPVTQVEPWWAPGTQVATLGRAGNGARTSGLVDCGRAVISAQGVDTPAAGCGCGPNLLYCIPKLRNAAGLDDDLNDFNPQSQRRLLWEEPARLFAHVIASDRPFSDLVLGDYTVVNQRLQHAYLRSGRMNTDNAALDTDQTWWRAVQDPRAWRQVPAASLTPHLLADRAYRFDPRTADNPRGMPAAGVLTTLGSLGSFARERVRAAKWLEVFACRTFAPPPATAVFPPYRRDAAREGQCMHCHQTIDPAAIHFKRLGLETDTGETFLGGIGPWKWSPDQLGYETYQRWENSFIHDTVLTPVDLTTLTAKPDARFIDFLPPDQKLFGLSSTGTVGPLGFGELLVSSGEFDRCAVKRLFHRFAGRELDDGTEIGLIRDLSTRFVAAGRKVKPFVRYLMSQDYFSEGF